MTRQADIKKGTAATAAVALLFLFVAAVTVNAADGDSTPTIQFTNAGDDMKSAKACWWNENSFYLIFMMKQDNPELNRGIDNCANGCKNNPDCKLWEYKDNRKRDWWICYGFTNSTVNSIASASNSEVWNTEKSKCGFIPSRANNLLQTYYN